MSGSSGPLPQFMRGQLSSPLTKRWIWCLSLAGIVLAAFLLNSAAGGEYIASHAYHYGVQDPLMDSILNETLGFQKIFVLNIKSRTDRRDGMALAASMTNLSLHFLEASTGVDEKALPIVAEGRHFDGKHLGSWRTHLNAALYMVENNVGSALVLEDDVDWDIHIHSQMQRLAKASALLTQPLSEAGGHIDPTYDGLGLDQKPNNYYVNDELPVVKPKVSPYGDDWDVLWLGHCGAILPTGQDDTKTPLGRAVMLDDPTVVDKHHINVQFGEEGWKDEYPPFTRLVFRTGGNVCSLAYALSLQGARKLLYELAIRKIDAEYDVELDSFCRGKNDRPLTKCLTTLPQYFQHHRPTGSWKTMSDISEMDDTVNMEAYTMNIRHATRVNLPKLVVGDTDWLEPYKDGVHNG